jgi:hypothetical protein
MSKRKDGLKPSEVARSKRVARAIANVLRNTAPHHRVFTVRNVVARLKAQRLRLRDFDMRNGEDAIGAIVSTMTSRELQGLPPPSMGKIWELTASRTIQLLGSKTEPRRWPPLGVRSTP